MFSTLTYTARRQQLKETIKSGVILLLGNEESSMNYKDNVYHFRQDSSFLYYFGLDHPHLAGIIDIDNGEEIVFGNELTIDDIVWTGPLPSLQDQAAQVGVTKTMPFNQIEKYLKSVQAQRRVIHFLPPYRPENQIKLREWFELPFETIPQHASVKLVEAVIAQRLIKSAEEVAEMEKALETTKEMHVAAMRAAKPGIVEAQLAGMVQGLAVSGGGQLAYPVILTINGQTLHNHHHHNVLQSGQLVLGDFGAETALHYAGDITRTFPVDQQFTAQQKEIYQIVLDAQMQAIAALKPEALYRDIHLLSSKVIAEGMKALGLMKGDCEAAVAAGAHALFFPHGLGHHIGLDVHDMEDLGEDRVGYSEDIKRSKQFGLRSLRLGRSLEAGNVLTVEPGIYFIPELIDRWRDEGKHLEFINYEKLEAYKSFGGIRIEDNILITEDGHRVLGPPIPKTIAEVEAIRQGK